MIRVIRGYFLALTESYIFIAILALGVGIFFANNILFLAGYTTVILQIIFFLSSLKIDIQKVKEAFKDIKVLLIVNVFMLLVLPVLTYYIASYFVPDMAIALTILAAMPSGMTAPLLVEVVKGDTNYSLVLTVTTSLLAPLSIPIVLKVLLGAQVEVSMFNMFFQIFYVIVIPFILAVIVKKYFHVHVKKSYFTFKPISLVLLGVLIAVLVAKNSQNILSDINNLGYYLTALILFFIILHIIGYNITLWKRREEKLTVAVNLTYMNFTLALYLAVIYFNEPNIILPLVLSIIPWALMLIPFKKTLQILNN